MRQRLFLGFFLWICCQGGYSHGTETLTPEEAAVRMDKEVAESFLQIYRTIKTNYRAPLADRALLVGALKGMLGILDPYSRYLGVEEMKNLMARTEGSRMGVGLELALEGDRIVVSAVEPEGPGDRAGVYEGMEVLAVAGAALEGKPASEALAIARSSLEGNPGETVSLKLFDPVLEKERMVSLKRVAVPSYQSFAFRHPVEEGVCVWVMTHLSSNSERQSAAALTRPELKGCQDWVLDLRENEGGDLEGTRAVLSHFYPKGEPLYLLERGPEGVKETIKSEGLKPAFPLPRLVMVSGKTASGAELIAQNLAAEKNVLVAGPDTVGKGLVQQILPLAGGDGFTLTVGQYTSLKGVSLTGVGVKPTVMVAWPESVRPSEEYRKVARALLPFMEGEPPPAPPDTNAPFWQHADRWLLLRGLTFIRELPAQRDSLWRAIRVVHAQRAGKPHLAMGIRAEEDQALKNAGTMARLRGRAPLTEAAFLTLAKAAPDSGGCQDLARDPVCLLFALGVVHRQGAKAPQLLQKALAALNQLGQAEAVLRMTAALEDRLSPDYFLQAVRAEPVIESALKQREGDTADRYLRPLLAEGTPTPALLYWDGVVALLKQDEARFERAAEALSASGQAARENFAGLLLTAAREWKSRGDLDRAGAAYERLPLNQLKPDIALEARQALLAMAQAGGRCQESVAHLKALALELPGDEAAQKEAWLGDLLKTSLRCQDAATAKASARLYLERGTSQDLRALADRALRLGE